MSHHREYAGDLATRIDPGGDCRRGEDGREGIEDEEVPRLNQRTAPVPPAPTGWELANREFEQGHVMRLGFRRYLASSDTVAEEDVPVAVTLGWVRAWQSLPLTDSQRHAVRNACIQIARDRIHPCLARRHVTQDPVGSWMASPSPGVTVTWRPHWSDADLPVMLTIEML